MPIASPLASLYTVLHAVRVSAETNAPLLRKNEAATRAALIDPVLRALGWDTANVQMVEPEKTINTAWRADYALHDASSKIISLIEAKCLGADLEKFSVVQQLLSYAFGFGVQKIVITDGISWHFYSEFKPGNSHASASFHLLQDDFNICALHLIQWLDAAQSGHGIIAFENYISQTAQGVPAAPPKKEKKPVVKVKKSADPISAPFIDLTHINTLQLEPNQKPKQLRLPDGTVKDIKSWKDILLEASQILLRENQSIALPFPDKSGKKTALFSRQKPIKGSSYSTTYKEQPLYIYTNYSAPSCLANALYIFGKLSEQQKKYAPAIAF